MTRNGDVNLNLDTTLDLVIDDLEAELGIAHRDLTPGAGTRPTGGQLELAGL